MFRLLFLNATVIACKPAFPAYAAALNPTDQVFDFEELEYHYLVANRTEDVPSKGRSELHTIDIPTNTGSTFICRGGRGG